MFNTVSQYFIFTDSWPLKGVNGSLRCCVGGSNGSGLCIEQVVACIDLIDIEEGVGDDCGCVVASHRRLSLSGCVYSATCAHSSVFLMLKCSVHNKISCLSRNRAGLHVLATASLRVPNVSVFLISKNSLAIDVRNNHAQAGRKQVSGSWDNIL